MPTARHVSSRDPLGPSPGRQVSEADRLFWIDDPEMCAPDRFTAAIYTLTGVAVSPLYFGCTVDGLTEYLQGNGVVHFNGPEWCKPRIRSLAERLYPHAPRDEQGRVIFLPGRWAWPRLACIGWILERLRAEGRKPMRIVNAWRPAEYNRAVTETDDLPLGTVNSDHVWCCGVDVVWPLDPSRKGWRKDAIWSVIGPLWRSRVLDLSVGLYRRRLHVGLLSPMGRRHWGTPPNQWPFGD